MACWYILLECGGAVGTGMMMLPASRDKFIIASLETMTPPTSYRFTTGMLWDHQIAVQFSSGSSSEMRGLAKKRWRCKSSSIQDLTDGGGKK